MLNFQIPEPERPLWRQGLGGAEACARQGGEGAGLNVLIDKSLGVD